MMGIFPPISKRTHRRSTVERARVCLSTILAGGYLSETHTHSMVPAKSPSCFFASQEATGTSLVRYKK
jgi:hypothetical protein